MPTQKHPRCDECKNAVPQVLEKVLKGKRIKLCFRCAGKAGWFNEEDPQGQLFKE